MDAPEEFLCPISYEIMSDPVLLVQTGVTYDRLSIVRWFSSGKRECPVTRIKLDAKSFAPNRALKSLIQNWLVQHRQSDTVTSTSSEVRPNATVYQESDSSNAEDTSTSGDDGCEVEQLPTIPSGVVRQRPIAMTTSQNSDPTLVQLENVQRLVSLLGHGNDFWKEDIVRCLGMLAWNNKEAKLRIVEAGAIPLLMELAESDSLACRRQAEFALALLGWNCQE